MEYRNLLLEIEDGIAVVRFNRPQVLNALNRETIEECIGIIQYLDEQEDVRVVILAGAGEKAFIAGADIAEMQDMHPVQALEFMQRGHEALAGLERMKKPVLAAVNGFALGGGAELTLACDCTFASENAKFGFPEVSLGIFPGFGGAQRLPRLLGKAKAKEMIFTGAMISAAEAYTIGLVNRVFPAADLLAETRTIALTIAKNGATALQSAKSAINAGYDLDLADGCALERNTIALCFSTEDQKARMKAFLERGK
jgi:enoyl-CoA hydratase